MLLDGGTGTGLAADGFSVATGDGGAGLGVAGFALAAEAVVAALEIFLTTFLRGGFLAIRAEPNTFNNRDKPARGFFALNAA